MLMNDRRPFPRADTNILVSRVHLFHTPIPEDEEAEAEVKAPQAEVQVLAVEEKEAEAEAHPEGDRDVEGDGDNSTVASLAASKDSHGEDGLEGGPSAAATAQPTKRATKTQGPKFNTEALVPKYAVRYDAQSYGVEHGVPPPETPLAAPSGFMFNYVNDANHLMGHDMRVQHGSVDVVFGWVNGQPRSVSDTPNLKSPKKGKAMAAKKPMSAKEKERAKAQAEFPEMLQYRQRVGSANYAECRVRVKPQNNKTLQKLLPPPLHVLLVEDGSEKDPEPRPGSSGGDRPPSRGKKSKKKGTGEKKGKKK